MLIRYVHPHDPSGFLLFGDYDICFCQRSLSMVYHKYIFYDTLLSHLMTIIIGPNRVEYHDKEATE